MPVRKFRSVEEMPPAPVATPFDPANLGRALELSKTCLGLSRSKPTPGVHKFRSVDEADEAQRR